MDNTVIKVHKLGKRYRIGAKQGEITNIREAVLDIAKAPIRNFRRLKSLTNFKDGKPEEANDIIWALKDVSFEVKQGEVVGIIGRNGAGKSTLLKILTRITEPTEGSAEIRGRVSSLLEVGTGFHPELTGRENVYLNGAILGMRKWEIDKKFDEIVAFAEVEKFLDTPVKRYSSGMQVRLAFAVAAHLEPEILLVDEVLAVGDMAFQKKCLGKMDEVAKGGRTVLFVSHNMGAVKKLCQKAILLKEGKIISSGVTENVINSYLEINGSEGGSKEILQPKNSDAYFEKITILDDQMKPSADLDIRKPFFVSLEYSIQKNIPGLNVAFYVCNKMGIKIFNSSKNVCSNGQCSKNVGRYRSVIKVPGLIITPDKYNISVALHQPRISFLALHENIISFQLHETGSVHSAFKGADNGVMFVNFEWQTENI